MGTKPPAPLRLQALDPRECRDEIVELCRRNGESDLLAALDWHFGDGACAARAWCLRASSGCIVGFMGLFERIARFGGDEYRVGVPGDLLIDRAHRSLSAAVALIRAPLELVDDDELDAVLVSGGVAGRSYGARSDRLIRRLGYRPLAQWQTHALLLRSRAWASRRFGVPGSMVSPLLDLRSRYRLWRWPAADGLAVMELTAEALAGLDSRDWNQRRLLSVDYHPHQLAWRFLHNPLLGGYQVLGIADGSEGCAGYVVATMADDRTTLRLHHLHVDERRLSVGDAVWWIARHVDCDAITISLLSGSPLGAELKAIGFLGGRASGVPVVGYWKRSDVPWGSAQHWRLFQGFTDV